MKKDTVLCPCFGVTVVDVENAIKDGAKTFEDVQNRTNLGMGCGMCNEHNQEVIEQMLKDAK